MKCFIGMKLSAFKALILSCLFFTPATHAVWVTYFPGLDQLSFNPRHLNPKDFPALINLAKSNARTAEHQAVIQKASEQIPEVFAKAELLMRVAEELPKIIAASDKNSRYSRQNRSYGEKALEIYDNTFTKNMYGIRDMESTVYFDYTVDGRFQVEGVAPDRLAYNDGQLIHFNLLALIQKKNLSLSEATQLWLHELNHFDKETPLDIKDKWVAEVANFVENRSKEIEVKSGHRFYTLNMPELNVITDDVTGLNIKVSSTQSYESPEPSLIIRERLKDHFLIFEQKDNTTRLFEPAYEGFQVFSSNLAPVHDLYQLGYHERFNWPQISVKSVQLNSVGMLLINYTTVLKSFSPSAAAQRTFTPVEDYHPVKAFIPEKASRMEISLKDGHKNIVPLYQNELAEGDFEVHRIEDRGDRRFLSLRLKMTEAAKILKSNTNLHLIAKDMRNSQQLSWSLNKFRIIGPDEVLIHLEVPQRNIELAYILAPSVDSTGWYSEKSIRPSRRFTILGTKDIKSESVRIDEIKIWEKKKKEDKVIAEISLQTQKKIVGLTLEMEHSLMSTSLSLNNLPLPGERFENENSIDASRKYGISKNMFSIKGSLLKFQIPEEFIEQITKGPRITKKIAWAYQTTYQERYRTIHDQKVRKITALWLHFDDGSVEKVRSEILPKRFSLISEQQKLERDKELFEESRRYRQQSVTSDFFKEEPIACGKVF